MNNAQFRAALVQIRDQQVAYINENIDELKRLLGINFNILSNE